MAPESPGVYIEEISTLPPSVAQVESAIPAFIGYTEFAKKSVDDDLRLKPARIGSMLEYEQLFGGPQAIYGHARETGFYADVSRDSIGNVGQVKVSEPRLVYLLHYAMGLYFANGGGPCYVVSVDGYDTEHPEIRLSANGNGSGGLMQGLDVLKSLDEPTLLVIPEAVQLRTDADYQSLVQAVLSQCGQLGDRFAIFDLRGGGAGFVADSGSATDSVADNNSLSRNRALFGMAHLAYGAAYYPFIRTTLNFFVDEHENNVLVKVDAEPEVSLGSLEAGDTDVYRKVKSEIAETCVVLPPSAAVAGRYVSTDGKHGVWKAPANVSLASTIQPLLAIDNATQEAMNVDITAGKSINAIRMFRGRGTLIWGARTLAGNDNEWRYIPVRRLMIMLEESLRKSTAWSVFEPNDATTWVKIRSMIEAYLVDLWRDGALRGATPEEAFFVQCGLGTTMTQNDISQGRLSVEIGVAPLRPAEFVILRFSHRMHAP